MVDFAFKWSDYWKKKAKKNGCYGVLFFVFLLFWIAGILITYWSFFKHFWVDDRDCKEGKTFIVASITIAVVFLIIS